jgi:hypothetical protein
MMQMMQITILAFVIILVNLPLILAACRNNCNMHGKCGTTSICECFSGWEGVECDRRTCPKGPIIADIATGVDTSHQLEQCSGRGDCNHKTGLCECSDSWGGPNCGRIVVDCNGHGTAMNLHDAAELNDGYNFNRTTTYNQWDAAIFSGCNCDPGWGGHDCSLRMCDSGPDLRRTLGKTSKKYETATLVCQCKSTGCSGNFKLNFMGQHTRKSLTPTSTARDVANLFLGYVPQARSVQGVRRDSNRQKNFGHSFLGYSNNTDLYDYPIIWAGTQSGHDQNGMGGPPITGSGESSSDPDDPDGKICNIGKKTFTNIHFKKWFDAKPPTVGIYAKSLTGARLDFETYQTLNCDCTANNCNGTFRFIHDGEISSRILSYAQASSVVTILENMKTVNQSGTVKYLQHHNQTLRDFDDPICLPGAIQKTTFRFTAQYGNIASLGLWSSVGPSTESRYSNMRTPYYDTASFAAGIYKTQYYATADMEKKNILTLVTNERDKEIMRMCNGIGTCNYETGQCLCPHGWGPTPPSASELARGNLEQNIDVGPCGHIQRNSSSANGIARCPGVVHKEIDTWKGYYPSRQNQPSRKPRVYISSNRSPNPNLWGNNQVHKSRISWHDYEIDPPLIKSAHWGARSYDTGKVLFNLSTDTSAGPLAYDAATDRLFFVDNNAANPFIGVFNAGDNSTQDSSYFTHRNSNNFDNDKNNNLKDSFEIFAVLPAQVNGFCFDNSIGERRIYWTQQNTLNAKDGGIYYVLADDTHRPAHIYRQMDRFGDYDNSHLVDPQGIAVHPVEKRLYWIDRMGEPGSYKGVLNSAYIHGAPDLRSIPLDKVVGTHTSTTHLSYTDVVIDWIHNNTAIVMDAGNPPAILAIPLTSTGQVNNRDQIDAASSEDKQYFKQRVVHGEVNNEVIETTAELKFLAVDAESNYVFWSDSNTKLINYAFVDERKEVVGQITTLNGTIPRYQLAYDGSSTNDKPVGMAFDMGLGRFPFDDKDYFECSGHGVCGGNKLNFQCTCMSGYEGGDCSQRSCPKGPAWFHEPMRDDIAHDVDMECSNMGRCDKSRGLCKCAGGFEGAACERMSCRGQTIKHNTCSGNGRCLSMRELARTKRKEDLKYDADAVYGSKLWDPTTWDADMISGCKPDEYGYYPGTTHNISNTHTNVGHSDLECPWGIDHRISELATKNDTSYAIREEWLDSRLKVREVQRIKCTANTGTFKLTFRNKTTNSIAYNANALTIKTALEELSSIGEVIVTIMETSDVPTLACSNTAGTNHYFDIEFRTELALLPLLELTDSLTHGSAKVFTVTQQKKGRGVLKECSGKGECNRQTGECKCWETWGSSDGFGGRGTRGDCGFSLVL